MKELIIKKHIDFTPEEEGVFRSISFELPENVKRLDLRWSLLDDGATINILDFALEDPDGFRGWSGYSFKDIFIDDERAAPGYLPGPLLPGFWTCRLGLTEIRSNGRADISIRALVEERYEEGRWYPGDLHLHSYHSGDGYYALHEISSFARERGLQFLALTDHNAQSQNADIPAASELLFIPSIELTSYKGHSNFWNLKTRLKRVICESRADVEACMADARDAGALISMNHPFAKDRWGWGYDLPFDAVEIWNSRWSDSDEKALSWWHESLCKGRRLCAVGGSDTHRLGGQRDFGCPVTRIRASYLSREALMDGIKAGRAVIAASSDSPWPDIRIGDLGTGDEGLFQSKEGAVLIENPDAGHILRIISDRGIEAELAMDEDTGELCFFVSEDRLFYRAEIRGSDGGMTAVGNPVFNVRIASRGKQ